MIQWVRGFVLRSEDRAEFDQRLTLYTLECGKLSANILGVKKNVSKLRGLTLPFTEYRFQVYLHGGKRTGMRDPGKILGGESLTHYSLLKEEWNRMIQASAITEILNVLTQPFYPNSTEYQWLCTNFAQLEWTLHPQLVRCRFVLGLLKILGYSLRSHSIWSSLSVAERTSLNQLARWDSQSNLFSESEIFHLSELTQSYLNRYLPFPLKTSLFEKKCEMASNY